MEKMTATLDETRTVTLMSPAIGSAEFSFAQPVPTVELIRAETLHLTRPLTEKTRIRCGARLGTVVATCVDGRVHVKWDDAEVEEVIDLSTVPHEFVLSY